MAALPVLRARQVIAALRRGWFHAHHQTGSHIVLRSDDEPHLRVTVPMHSRDLKKGTLRTIIRQADQSVEAFTKLL